MFFLCLGDGCGLRLGRCRLQGVSSERPPKEWGDEVARMMLLDEESAWIHRYGDVAGDEELLIALRKKVEIENGIRDKEIMVTAGANQVRGAIPPKKKKKERGFDDVLAAAHCCPVTPVIPMISP